MLDPRLHAYRDDLADARLRGRVEAGRFVEGKPARVIIGRAAVRRAPDARGETVTFCHYGERVLVFGQAAGFAWCQSEFDGYVGYVDTRAVALGEPPAPTHVVANMGAYLYEAPDLRSPSKDFLPRHSGVVVAETGLMTRGTEYARIETGGFLPLACLSDKAPQSPDLVSAAERYLGCPYLWGGRSFLGIDCSGLVQNAFRDLGAMVLRDTDMQRDTIGERVAARDEADLRRGDLLYMPGHVLIYAGDGAVIHADGGSMTVRRDDFAALMQVRGWEWAIFNIRRP